MDLQGIPKRTYRGSIIETYQACSGENELRPGHHIFTMCGPAQGEYSEVNYLCRHRDFCQVNQYTSVERDRKTHLRNARMFGPTWLYGDFTQHFQQWYPNLPSGEEAGIVHADWMCGIEKAMGDIQTVVETIQQCRETTRPFCLLVVNLLQSNRWRENQGITFLDVVDTFKRSHMRALWKKVVHQQQYQNKTVGKGCGVSTLQTLMFWL
jgi:hypothetical protein